MSDSADEEIVGEVDTYEPVPACVGDGEVLIADPAEFCQLTGSIAAQVRDGALFVLGRDTLKWVNVETIRRPKSASVAAIK